MSHLRHELAIEQQRALRRRRRHRQDAVVSIVGYTNAASPRRSTAFPAVRAGGGCCSPRDPTTRRVHRPVAGGAVTDTVGFIQKLPTQLEAAFHATLQVLTRIC